MINFMLAQLLAVRAGWARRPTPNFDRLELPGWLWPGVAVAAVLVLAGGIIGDLGWSLLIVLVVPYLFLGLALVHVVVRRWSRPGLALAAIYGAHDPARLADPPGAAARLRRGLGAPAPPLAVETREFGEPHAGGVVGAHREARADGRRGRRQGRLRAQLSGAARQGAARDQGQSRRVRAAPGAARGGQPGAQGRGEQAGPPDRRPRRRDRPPGGRSRPALRLGQRARHRGRVHRGRADHRAPPGAAARRAQGARHPPGAHPPPSRGRCHRLGQHRAHAGGGRDPGGSGARRRVRRRARRSNRRCRKCRRNFSRTRRSRPSESGPRRPARAACSLPQRRKIWPVRRVVL